jgi:hypothetical protein
MQQMMPNSAPLLQRVWRAGALALGGVIAANLLVRAVAYTAFDVPHAFPLLQVGPAIAWAGLFVAGLVAVRGLLELRSRDAASSFLPIALKTLGVLLCLDIALMLVPVLPGTASASILTLMVMQSLSVGVSVYFLGTP